jgi:hypothetical protein
MIDNRRSPSIRLFVSTESGNVSLPPIQIASRIKVENGEAQLQIFTELTHSVRKETYQHWICVVVEDEIQLGPKSWRLLEEELHPRNRDSPFVALVAKSFDFASP